MVDDVLIDFGNGITCYTQPHMGEACLEQGHQGFHSPEIELVIDENSLNDGGSIGASRALCRHLRCSISHKNKWTRREILSAFSPGVERTLSTPTCSMPYRLKSAVEFPESLWEAQWRFTVTLASELAYPVAATSGHTMATGTGTFASGSDVGCPASFAVTVPAGGGSELVLVTPAGTTTITGTMLAAKVVVIDSEAHTVTYDGLAKLDWFDRDGVWPMLASGNNTVSAEVDSAAAAMTVTWAARLMGLL